MLTPPAAAALAASPCSAVLRDSKSWAVLPPSKRFELLLLPSSLPVEEPSPLP